MRTMLVVCALLWVLQLASAAIVSQTLTVAWKTQALDGYSRRVITVNGVSPGPMIKVTYGDSLLVKVINNLDRPMAMHWHGLTQVGSNDADGVPGITQLAIQPKMSYDYKFKPHRPGTFWYHSHFHTEYMDGLLGPLIVLPTSGIHYKRDSVVLLQDWYSTTETEKLLKGVVLKPGGTGVEPLPTAGLVGGVGQRLGSACARGCPTTCVTGVATAACPKCKGATKPAACHFKQIQAQPGGTCAKPATKLRIIAASGYAAFSLSIDEHLMTIVAADVFPVKPVTVGSLFVNVGQRYEVLVCRSVNPASTTPAWIRVRFQGLNMGTKLASPDFLAILTYDNLTTTTTAPRAAAAPVQIKRFPATKYDAKLALTNVAKTYPQVAPAVDAYKRYDPDPWGLVLSPPIPAPKATRTINLTIGFYPNMQTKVFEANINGISFNPGNPTTPLLTLFKAGKPLPAKPGLHLIKIPQGQVVDLFIRNIDYRIHPMHMHGYDVWVMARGKTGALNTLASLPGRYPALSPTPLMRDTVTVMPQSYIVLRVQANNPGLWLFHCHVEWHIAAGMVNLFQVGGK